MPAPKKPVEPISVKELAAQLNTDPRTLRGFLRRSGQAAGKGARYAFDPAGVKAVTKAWTEAQAASADEAAEPVTA